MKNFFLISFCLLLSLPSFSEVKAVYNNDKVEISWTNPLFIEIDYFVIERSKNGKNFNEIQKVEGTKNQKIPLEYVEIDYHPFHKKTYYRIKQIHVNGRIYYSNTTLAKTTQNVNPTTQLFSKSANVKHLKNYKNTNVLVVLTGKVGDEYIAIINVETSKKQLIITQTNVNLPTGAYLVSATSDDLIYGKQIYNNGIYAKSGVYTQRTE